MVILTAADHYVTVVVTALLVHCFFSRYEPRKPSLIVFLLCGTPTCLTLLIRGAFPSLLRAVIVTFLLFFAALIGSLVAYRLSPIHPLSKFPGPIINRISPLKMIQVSISGKRHLYVQALHEKYGPYVRIGPNILSISDANAVFPIFGAKGQWPRGESYHASKPPSVPDSLISQRDISLHSDMRKVWVRAFTPTALKGHDEIVVRRAKELIGIFDELVRENRVVDMEKWIGYFTFDFAGDLVFGGGCEFMKDGKDSQHIRRNLIIGQSIHYILKYVPWIANFLPLIPGWRSNDLTRYFRKLLEARLKEGTVLKDIVHYLEESNTTEYAADVDHLLEEAILAFAGGSDTSSTVMTDLIYLLVTHPEIYQKLQNEIDRVDQVEGHEDVMNLPYLEACIQETLRLIPPLPTGVGRTPPRGGAFLGENYIPDGTSVFFPHYVLHHNPDNFSDPDRFWPERWIIASSSSDSEKLVHNWDAFIPFSFGPSNCIGKKLAFREMYMVITMILRKYQIRLAPGYDKERYWYEMRDEGIFKKGELPVVLEERR